ncbi:MAG: BirA family biotin operon repressor/biotin-[acetyl-CoA-carboxylase] ligase [Paracoccaceae bacterium]|jgi:BirA family biotin operon repressor/biotin-[acetyl-CoA-carboxylase] ligase
MSNTPVFPPLLRGEAVVGAADPFDRALAMAALGCDGGTVVHNVQADRLRAALVFAPEVPLGQAMEMLVVCGLGFQNALGALAPPEVAVHLGWDGAISVNGASCGALRVAASTDDATAVPDWLIIGLDVPIIQTAVAPGDTPNITSLYDEGCGEVEPLVLLESWARHTLVWLNRWEGEGTAPLHAEWLGLVQGVGEPVERAGFHGTFLGVDEQFGMLIRDTDTTHLLPLSCLLGDRP